MLKKAKKVIKIDEETVSNAEKIEKHKIKGLDALHLASAEKLKADFFITCDDRIIKNYKGNMKVVSPIEFVLITTKIEE